MAGWNRYGYYRYGRSKYRGEDGPTGRRAEDEGFHPRDLFGAGIALKSAKEDGVPWDFVADSSGDLGATVGADELRKDLAFGTARDATGLIGTLASQNDFTRLENDIERVAATDSRITDAQAVVSRSPSRYGTIDAIVDIEADTGRLPRMVFPVN